MLSVILLCCVICNIVQINGQIPRKLNYLYVSMYCIRGKTHWAKLPQFSWFSRVLRKFFRDYKCFSFIIVKTSMNKHFCPRKHESIYINNSMGLKLRTSRPVNLPCPWNVTSFLTQTFSLIVIRMHNQSTICKQIQVNQLIIGQVLLHLICLCIF